MERDLKLMEKAAAPFGIDKISKDDLIIDFTGSDESVDRDEERMIMAGADIRYYKRVPMFLWAHDHYMFPLGNSRKVRIEGKKMRFSVKFTPEELNPVGYQAYQLYAGEVLHACSIGFGSAKREYVRSPKEGAARALVTAWELWELSGCNVGSNRNTFADAVNKGVMSENMLNVFAGGPTATPKQLLTVRVKGVKSIDGVDTTEIEVSKGIKGRFVKKEDGTYEVERLMFGADEWALKDAVAWTKENAKAIEMGNDRSVAVTVDLDEADDGADNGDDKSVGPKGPTPDKSKPADGSHGGDNAPSENRVKAIEGMAIALSGAEEPKKDRAALLDAWQK